MDLPALLRHWLPGWRAGRDRPDAPPRPDPGFCNTLLSIPSWTPKPNLLNWVMFSIFPFSSLPVRRTATTVTLLFLVIGVLWWSLWSFAAAQYRGVIDNWISTGRSSGYHIDYDSSVMFGFPHHVVLRLTNLRWVDTDGINFHAGQMDLSSTPWSWSVFSASFKGHVELAAPLDTEGRSLSLGGEQGYAHVELDKDGIWKLSRVSLMQAHVGRAPDVLFLADKLEASVQRPEHPPKDHTQPGLILDGKAENVVLPVNMPVPFGPKMKIVQSSLRVMGDMPDFRRRDSVAAWNSIGGVVDFDKLHMEWGPLMLVAKGALGFDDDLQPEGAFSSAIGHHKEVLKALMEHDFIAKNQAGMLDQALSLFAKPADNAPGIEVPITVQLGGLFLGPVKIFTFPEIEWPKAEPASTPPAGTGN